MINNFLVLQIFIVRLIDLERVDGSNHDKVYHKGLNVKVSLHFLGTHV